MTLSGPDDPRWGAAVDAYIQRQPEEPCNQCNGEGCLQCEPDDDRDRWDEDWEWENDWYPAKEYE